MAPTSGEVLWFDITVTVTDDSGDIYTAMASPSPSHAGGIMFPWVRLYRRHKSIALRLTCNADDLTATDPTLDPIPSNFWDIFIRNSDPEHGPVLDTSVRVNIAAQSTVAVTVKAPIRPI